MDGGPWDINTACPSPRHLMREGLKKGLREAQGCPHLPTPAEAAFTRHFPPHAPSASPTHQPESNNLPHFRCHHPVQLQMQWATRSHLPSLPCPAHLSAVCLPAKLEVGFPLPLPRDTTLNSLELQIHKVGEKWGLGGVYHLLGGLLLSWWTLGEPLTPTYIMDMIFIEKIFSFQILEYKCQVLIIWSLGFIRVSQFPVLHFKHIEHLQCARPISQTGQESVQRGQIRRTISGLMRSHLNKRRIFSVVWKPQWASSLPYSSKEWSCRKTGQAFKRKTPVRGRNRDNPNTLIDINPELLVCQWLHCS